MPSSLGGLRQPPPQPPLWGHVRSLEAWPLSLQTWRLELWDQGSPLPRPPPGSKQGISAWDQAVGGRGESFTW